VKHWGYYFREAASNIARGGVLTAAATLAITFAGLIIGVFALAYVNLQAIYAEARREVYIDVYLKDEVRTSRAAVIGVHLRRLAGVARADYVSPEAAAREFVGLFPDDKDVLAAAGFNPLPASYRVYLTPEATTTADVNRLIKSIAAVDGVEEAIYGQEWLGDLERAANAVAMVGVAVGVVLGATAVLVVMSTIGLTVYARRDSIAVMKVVGATDGFVQTPFVFEGMFIGWGGGIIALAALYGGVAALGRAGLDVIFLPWHYVVAALALSGGAGGFGSFSAVRKFLRV
jgi:cell division transport system permease protein